MHLVLCQTVIGLLFCKTGEDAVEVRDVTDNLRMTATPLFPRFYFPSTELVNCIQFHPVSQILYAYGSQVKILLHMVYFLVLEHGKKIAPSLN